MNNMSYFYFFIILLHLIEILKGDLNLIVVKTINETEVPVDDKLHELAGTNLTLTCKLVWDNGTSNSTYFDDEVSWGRRNKMVQFENVIDLKNLASDNKKPLHQFLYKSDPNRATLHFNPLLPFDSGPHFCMSLKYDLFIIIKLEVRVGTEANELALYMKSLDVSRLNFQTFELKKPHSFPKFMCTEENFICKSNAACVVFQYVCDGVKDCADGSDENVNFCGNDPCAGKKQCPDRRCISESLCCDKYRDPNCTVKVRPSCCGNKDSEPKIPTYIAPRHSFDMLDEIKELQSRITNDYNKDEGNEHNGRDIYGTLFKQLNNKQDFSNNEDDNLDDPLGAWFKQYTNDKQSNDENVNLHKKYSDFGDFKDILDMVHKYDPTKHTDLFSTRLDDNTDRFSNEHDQNINQFNNHHDHVDHNNNFNYKPNDYGDYFDRYNDYNRKYDSTHNTDIQDIWKTPKKKPSPKDKTLWYVIPIAIILVVIIAGIVLRQYLTKRGNRSRQRTVSTPAPLVITRGFSPSAPTCGRTSPAASACISPSRQANEVSTLTSLISHNADLPPSYDEAVTNSQPSAPPLEK